MTPTDFDPEYGWILPSPSASWGAARKVAGFVEKPDRQTARDFMELGALLNTLIFVADASALLSIYEETLPALLRQFLRVMGAGGDAATLAGLYEALPTRDFSRDVLERAPHRLRVMRVPSAAGATSARRRGSSCS
jgi:mannose-1-phosphate guanylyltransferase